MSELIDNREYRQKVLKELIMELHYGKSVEEVQRLCDVYSAVFKGSIEDIHREVSLVEIKGHPLHTCTIENEAII